MKQFRGFIAAIQEDRDAIVEVRGKQLAAENIIREVCKGAAEAAPVDDLISLALFVADMGEKAARDAAMEN